MMFCVYENYKEKKARIQHKTVACMDFLFSHWANFCAFCYQLPWWGVYVWLMLKIPRKSVVEYNFFFLLHFCAIRWKAFSFLNAFQAFLFVFTLQEFMTLMRTWNVFICQVKATENFLFFFEKWFTLKWIILAKGC